MIEQLGRAAGTSGELVLRRWVHDDGTAHPHRWGAVLLGVGIGPGRPRSRGHGGQDPAGGT